MVQSSHQQAEAAYERILEAVEEIMMLATDAGEDDDIDHGEIIHHFVEEAGERGLDEDQVERMFKSVYALTKKA